MDLAIAGKGNGFSKPHATLAYGQNNSWELLYNLFADKEVGLNLVPQSVYDVQSEFYMTVFDEYGVPLDMRNTWTKGELEGVDGLVTRHHR